jgi:hypothetical protein
MWRRHACPLLHLFPSLVSPSMMLYSDKRTLGRHPTAVDLIEQVHEACRTKHSSPLTEDAYVSRIERFLRSQPGKTGA